MHAFTFSLPTQILFGPGTENEVGRQILQQGGHTCLLYTSLLVHSPDDQKVPVGGRSYHPVGLIDKGVGDLKRVAASVIPGGDKGAGAGDGFSIHISDGDAPQKGGDGIATAVIESG